MDVVRTQFNDTSQTDKRSGICLNSLWQNRGQTFYANLEIQRVSRRGQLLIKLSVWVQSIPFQTYNTRRKRFHPLLSLQTPYKNIVKNNTRALQKQTPQKRNASITYVHGTYAAFIPLFFARPFARDLLRRVLFAFQSISKSFSLSLRMEAVKSRWRKCLRLEWEDVGRSPGKWLTGVGVRLGGRRAVTAAYDNFWNERNLNSLVRSLRHRVNTYTHPRHRKSL